jgi:hypothetical protein
MEEWLFYFLHLSTLNRLHPALFFSGCCSAFHAVVLFAEMPSFYYIQHKYTRVCSTVQTYSLPITYCGRFFSPRSEQSLLHLTYRSLKWFGRWNCLMLSTDGLSSSSHLNVEESDYIYFSNRNYKLCTLQSLLASFAVNSELQTARKNLKAHAGLHT